MFSPLSVFAFRQFSTPPAPKEEPVDWEKVDLASYRNLHSDKSTSKLYVKLQNRWKIPVEKKKRKRAEKLQRESEFERPAPQPEQLVIHNPAKPVTYPPDPYGVFAMVQFNGKQYKVTKDETMMIERPNFEKQFIVEDGKETQGKLIYQLTTSTDGEEIEEISDDEGVHDEIDSSSDTYLDIPKSLKVGDQIVIDQVMLLGTKDYTCIGQPFVNSARVYATVEEMSKTQKVIIFKKRRRKGYQKNQGHRQNIFVLRIENIVHVMDQQQIENYKPLKLD